VNTKTRGAACAARQGEGDDSRQGLGCHRGQIAQVDGQRFAAHEPPVALVPDEIHAVVQHVAGDHTAGIRRQFQDGSVVTDA